jgi:ADP-heptose:LPS heptosyltransferase
MGIGDEIMASGHARAVHRQTGKRVQIVDVHGRVRWSPMWDGLPWIAGPKESGDFEIIRNAAQCRPYIAYPFTIETGQKFTDWRARDHLGAIVLTEEEKREAQRLTADIGPFVVIEPNLSMKANPNKQWGKERWQALAGRMIEEDFTPVQMAWGGPTVLCGAKQVPTPNFRLGAAVLALAQAAVLPEGGLHHAAGVLNVPSVVLFGGMISPETTGYPGHVNLVDSGPGSPCGKWRPCIHCRKIWTKLDPRTVMRALLELPLARAA